MSQILPCVGLRYKVRAGQAQQYPAAASQKGPTLRPERVARHFCGIVASHDDTRATATTP